MNLIGVATKAGTTGPDMEKLLTSGEGSLLLAARIGTTSRNISEFIDGRAASAGIAAALGTN